MNFGNYIPWLPVKDAEKEYRIDDFHYNFRELVIEMYRKDEQKRNVAMKITFPVLRTVCRVTNESFTGALAAHLEENLKNYSVYGNLFKVEGSQFLKTISEESYTMSDILDLRHYFMGDSEWVFDIASNCQPRVELYVNGKLEDRSELISHRSLA